MHKLPLISKELVENMEALFPPKDMRHDDDVDYHRWYGGCRHVVKLLRQHHNLQEKQFNYNL